MTTVQNDEKLMEQGYRKAIDLLGECSRPEGFLASPTNDQNYRRVWGRDSVIIGLAALLTEDKELIDAFRNSLETLARYQGPHGEIPSNVDPKNVRISYGGMTGRRSRGTCGKSVGYDRVAPARTRETESFQAELLYRCQR